jgi:hypothetical protein
VSNTCSADTSVIEQRRGKESYRVELASGELRYRTASPRGEGSATVPYELLSRKTTRYTRSNPFFRNAAIYFAILSVITVGFGFATGFDAPVAVLWALIAGACYLVFRLTGVAYEVFPLADGRVFRLMENRPTKERYEAFRAELFSRRDAYLLDRYARIDVERPARLERKRIDWLRDEGVVDDNVYVTIVETIDEHAPQS